MRVAVEISYDAEVPVEAGQTWIDVVDAMRAKLEADLAACLGGTESRVGPIRVSVKPR